MAVYVQIYRDAENGEFVLRNVDENGDLIADLPEIKLKLQDLEYAEELVAKLRRVHYTDAGDSSKKRCYGLFTKPESDAASDGHDSATEDLHLGGGGGGGTRYRIKAVHGDYLTCRTWDGATEGEEDVYVAKPEELRHSVTPDEIYLTQVIEGVTINFTWQARAGTGWENLDGQRTETPYPDTDPTSSQVAIVIPVYLVDDEIVAGTPEGGTGVVTEGDTPVAVTLEFEAGGRAWCQVE